MRKSTKIIILMFVVMVIGIIITATSRADDTNLKYITSQTGTFRSIFLPGPYTDYSPFFRTIFASMYTTNYVAGYNFTDTTFSQIDTVASYDTNWDVWVNKSNAVFGTGEGIPTGNSEIILTLFNGTELVQKSSAGSDKRWRGVWTNETLIVGVADEPERIQVWNRTSTNIIASQDIYATSWEMKDVWSNNSYNSGVGSVIYVSTEGAGLIQLYYDGSISYGTQYYADGNDYEGMWSNGSHIFVAVSGTYPGIHIYKFTGYGTAGSESVTLVDYYNTSNDVYDVFYDDNYVYAANGNDGLKVLNWNGTNLSLVGTIDNGGDYFSVTGNKTHIFAGTITSVSGMHAYIKQSQPNCTTWNATTVGGTTATLKGQVQEGFNTTCGFYLVSSVETKNVTCTGTYDGGEYFTKSVTSLLPGEYYNVTAWVNNDLGFYNATNSSYMITVPNSTSNFVGSNATATTIDFAWSNATYPDGTNYSAVIYYDTVAPGAGSNPGNWGNLGANISNAESTTITGLSPDTLYYFAIWSYVNDSGSPSLAKFSSSFETTSNETIGGNYTVFVRYENQSTSGNLLVNLSSGGIHKFTIHYTDTTEEITINNGEIQTTPGFYGSISTDTLDNGTFEIYANKTVQWIEFHWNSTGWWNWTWVSKDFNCYRSILPLSEQRNITFYVRTNLPVYGENSAYFNESLVRYTYTFKDPSGIFTPDNNAYIDIYTFNSTGTRLTIHREYLTSNKQVYPMLIFNKKYFVGVGSNNPTIDRIAVAPTGDDTTPEAIEIPYDTPVTYTFFDIINLDIGWNEPGSGFYVNYQDTLFGTNETTIYIWDINNTLVYNETTTNNLYNFTYNDANPNQTYKVKLSVNHSVWLTNKSINFSVYGDFTEITNIASLNEFCNLTFGYTPLQNFKTGEEVPWTYIIVGIIGFILLTSFGFYNAPVGIMALGGWILLSTTFIGGLPVTWFAIGVFLIAMGIIFALGGKRS